MADDRTTMIRPTLIRPPPEDPNVAPIENILHVTELGVFGPDIFTNTRKQLLPRMARGIFGGAMIAQCIGSAVRTVPSDFHVHSCHCYFLLPGDSQIPILFHVERVMDGRSFATRTVQARQRGRCIFTVTASFTRRDPRPLPHTLSTPATSSSQSRSGIARDAALALTAVRPQQPQPKSHPRALHHHAPFPTKESPPTDAEVHRFESSFDNVADNFDSLVQNYKLRFVGADDRPLAGPPAAAGLVGSDGRLERLRVRSWMRARGTIKGGIAAHLIALAYMSDSYFLGTVMRIHGVWPWSFGPAAVKGMVESDRKRVLRTLEFEGEIANQTEGRRVLKLGPDPDARKSDSTPSSSFTSKDTSAISGVSSATHSPGFTYSPEAVNAADQAKFARWNERPRLGMMVSLDHALYFHEPEKVRADRWMLFDMESPWAGEGRGVVQMRIFGEDGTLLATCFQEGVVRLKRDNNQVNVKEAASLTKAKL